MKLHIWAAITGGILSAGLALAQPGNPGQDGQTGPPGGRGHSQHGMMGCPGMAGAGFGMMGRLRDIPDLTPDQRSKITAIRRDLRDRQIKLMDKMQDTMSATRYYRDGKFDEQAARSAYDSVEKLRRQMFENLLDAHKRFDAVLTPAQRQQLARSSGRNQQ